MELLFPCDYLLPNFISFIISWPKTKDKYPLPKTQSKEILLLKEKLHLRLQWKKWRKWGEFNKKQRHPLIKLNSLNTFLKGLVRQKYKMIDSGCTSRYRGVTIELSRAATEDINPNRAEKCTIIEIIRSWPTRIAWKD